MGAVFGGNRGLGKAMDPIGPGRGSGQPSAPGCRNFPVLALPETSCRNIHINNYK